MKKIIITLMIILLVSLSFGARIKDVAQIQNVRSNQLVGYGLVVGLSGTGDKTGAAFTTKSLASMLASMGVVISEAQISSKNVAAVMVTAELGAFEKPGSKIDITVSSIGDATSLAGGILIQTPLKAGNGQVYAVAQGPVSIGGLPSEARNVQNHSLVGSIADGAIVERGTTTDLLSGNRIHITLNTADFTTSSRLAKSINKNFRSEIAYPVDGSTIAVEIPPAFLDDRYLITFISEIEGLEIIPDSQSKIVINERTGTIVAGENIMIAPVAISHGELNIQIGEELAVNGQTIQRVLSMPSLTNANDVSRALNTIGVTPQDIISIFYALKAAGALQAEIVMM